MNEMDKIFWNIKNEATEPELIIDGEIASYGWYGDEVTPKQFKNDLNKLQGKDITVWVNSPGGDVFAGSCIYTMLKEHKGKVTVKIDGLAASAASVIAMAGHVVQMSPTSMMMIHNPWTVAAGDIKELNTARQRLEECKESIINAYALKTGITRDELSKLMDDETWMSANTAIEKGFASEMLYTDNNSQKPQIFAKSIVFNSILNIKTENKDGASNIEILKLKSKLLSL